MGRGRSGGKGRVRGAQAAVAARALLTLALTLALALALTLTLTLTLTLFLTVAARALVRGQLRFAQAVVVPRPPRPRPPLVSRRRSLGVAGVVAALPLEVPVLGQIAHLLPPSDDVHTRGAAAHPVQQRRRQEADHAREAIRRHQQRRVAHLVRERESPTRSEAGPACCVLPSCTCMHADA